MKAPGNLDGKCFAMLGPMRIVDPAHTPVRGDLADIRLAGRYFVPHYAVPMPAVVTKPMWLRSSPRLDAEELCEMQAGKTFNVLDVTGQWAWGQVADDGYVGYMLLTNLATNGS